MKDVQASVAAGRPLFVKRGSARMADPLADAVEGNTTERIGPSAFVAANHRTAPPFSCL
jgi:hypothetical protein